MINRNQTISYTHRPTFNGTAIKTQAPPMARSKASYPVSKTAMKVRAQAKNPSSLTNVSPPMARPVSDGGLMGRIKSAFKNNSGNNQRLAKQRMNKASRK